MEIARTGLERARRDLEETSNSLESARIDMEEASNDLERTRRGLEETSNNLERARIDLEETSYDLERVYIFCTVPSAKLLKNVRQGVKSTATRLSMLRWKLLKSK